MAEENHDLLIEIRADVKHIKKELGDVKDRLKEGDESLKDHEVHLATLEQGLETADKKIEKHTDGHWKFATLVVGVVSAIVGIALFIIRLTGGA